MRLLLIRHGETDWNVETRVQGMTDIPLNATGVRQARQVAQALAGETLAAVFASPLQRALHTAQAIAQPHHLPVYTHSGLRELDQGDLEGMLAADIRLHPSGVSQQWAAGNLHAVVPGGESMAQLQQRAWEAVADIRRQVGDGTVVVVSHNLTTKAIICSALDVPLIAYRRLRKENGSVTTLEFTGDHATLVRLNDVSHYALTGEPSPA